MPNKESQVKAKVKAEKKSLPLPVPLPDFLKMIAQMRQNSGILRQQPVFRSNSGC